MARMRRLGIGVSLSAALLVGMALPGAASSVPGPAGTGSGVVAKAIPVPARPAAFPRSNISTGNVYKPAALTAKPVPSGCTSTNYSLSIWNETRISQQITYNGSNVGGPLSPGHGDALCLIGSDGAVAMFHLTSNSKAHLKVTLS